MNSVQFFAFLGLYLTMGLAYLYPQWSTMYHDEQVFCRNERDVALFRMVAMMILILFVAGWPLVLSAQMAIRSYDSFKR